jgi:micrococcal nuclease
MTSPGPSGSLSEARVVAVLDGDTISLDSGERVRYLGVDTPELQRERSAEQAFAREAAERNQQLVRGKTVLLEADAEDRDRYGRLLGYLWVDGQNLSVRLAAEGYATQLTIPPNVKYAEEIAAAEAGAREQGLGLWADCGGPGVPPTDYEEPAPESGGDVAPPGRGQPNDTQKHPTGVARMNTAVPMRMP